MECTIAVIFEWSFKNSSVPHRGMNFYNSCADYSICHRILILDRYHMLYNAGLAAVLCSSSLNTTPRVAVELVWLPIAIDTDGPRPLRCRTCILPHNAVAALAVPVRIPRCVYCIFRIPMSHPALGIASRPSLCLRELASLSLILGFRLSAYCCRRSLPLLHTMIALVQVRLQYRRSPFSTSISNLHNFCFLFSWLAAEIFYSLRDDLTFGHPP